MMQPLGAVSAASATRMDYSCLLYPYSTSSMADVSLACVIRSVTGNGAQSCLLKVC